MGSERWTALEGESNTWVWRNTQERVQHGGGLGGTQVRERATVLRREKDK